MMEKKTILPTFMQFQKMIADKKQREKWKINKIIVGSIWQPLPSPPNIFKSTK